MPHTAPETGVFVEDARRRASGENCSTLLRAYGLDLLDWQVDPFVVERGITVSLSGSESAPLFRRLLRTSDLDQFKQWIGVRDHRIETGRALPPKTLPKISPRRLEKTGTLSAREAADLKLARDYFLFGRSALVEDYRGAITMHYAPFEAALYTARRLEILEEASLEIVQSPAILLVDTLVLHGGANLKIFTPSKVVIDTVHKVHA